jgi:hypothetical protein
MNTPLKYLTSVAIAAFCLSVIFAPWDSKLMVNGNSVSLGTIYSPIWKPPISSTQNSINKKTIKRAFTSDELITLEKEGYDTSKYKGELVELPIELESSPRPTSVNLRFESLLFEWGAIVVIYFGLFFMLKPKAPTPAR